MCPYCESDLYEIIHEGSNYLVDDPTIYLCKNCNREYDETEIIIEDEDESDESNKADSNFSL